MPNRKTERERAHQNAIDEGQIWTHVFRCDDGELFEATAATEKRAFRVLNAERPGMRARYVGVKE